MTLGPFQEVILESSSVEELKEKVSVTCHRILEPVQTFVVVHSHVSCVLFAA